MNDTNGTGERFEDVLGEQDADLGEVAQMLSSGRPLPSPTFRGALARRLKGLPIPISGRRLWPAVAALTVSGALALGIVALGVAGSGPLAF